MQYQDIIDRITSLADPAAAVGMARYGINTDSAYGVSVYTLQKMAREIGKDHELAQRLWGSGIHEARILACLVETSATCAAGTSSTGRHWLMTRRLNGAGAGRSSSSGPDLCSWPPWRSMIRKLPIRIS
jgi:3-methyladenine DNA glycosylase AlkD